MFYNLTIKDTNNNILHMLTVREDPQSDNPFYLGYHSYKILNKQYGTTVFDVELIVEEINNGSKS